MEIILSGILSGVMASFVFYFLMISVKPKVKIAEDMCMEKESDGSIVCTIKVVNLSKTILTNIDYQLTYCEKSADGCDNVNIIKPRKDKILYMDKYSRRKKDYAYQISYQIDSDCFDDALDWRFEFNFSAMHSFSNSVIVKNQSFTNENIKRGRYESGKNMGIICM